MKSKKTLFVLILVFLSAKTFCQTYTPSKDLTFTIEPEFGFINGTIVENVWNASSAYNNTTITLKPTTKLSRLDWQIKNQKYTGFELDIALFEKLAFNFGFQNAFSGTCGIMEDYDWKSPDPEHLTNYSRHNNELKNYTKLDLTAGYIFSFKTFLPISIAPQIGIVYQGNSFSGIGGYKSYESNNWKIVDFENQPVIAYMQNFTAFKFKLRTKLDILNYAGLRLDLCAAYSPMLNAIDSHLKRSHYFNDRIQDICFLQSELLIFAKLGKMHRFGIKGNVDFMPEAFGFTYISTESTQSFPEKPDLDGLGSTSRLIFSYAIVYQIEF